MSEVSCISKIYWVDAKDKLPPKTVKDGDETASDLVMVSVFYESYGRHIVVDCRYNYTFNCWEVLMEADCGYYESLYGTVEFWARYPDPVTPNDIRKDGLSWQSINDQN